MLRKLALAAALVAATARYGAAAACGAAGSIVNGFEGAGTTCTTVDVTNWSTSFAMSAAGQATTGIPPAEGNFVGLIDWTGSAGLHALGLTLPAASFDSGGSNWATQGYLYVGYASITTLASSYSTLLILSGTAGAQYPFNPGNGKNLTRTAYASPADWTYDIVSLNYARNLGVDLSNVTAISIEEVASLGSPRAAICFDNLALDGISDTPNSNVPSGSIFATAGCGAFVISWTAQSQSGTDLIAGYHIYRSTNGTSGPFVSLGYVTSTSFTETVSLSSTQSYVVLPYSTFTAAVGGAQAYFMYYKTDPGAPTKGVNEILMNPGSMASAVFNPFGGCSPTPTPSPSFTASPTATQTPSPTATPTFTNSPTSTPTATNTPTFTATPTNTQTFTPVPTLAGTGTGTPTPGPSATVSPTPPPSPTISPTFTASPQATPVFSPTPTPVVTNTVNASVGAQLYPNPFHPDQGEVFHLGNVPAGAAMTIYNIIGEYVYSATLKGNPALDVWDGLNANGVKVVTGIYFVVVQGKVYRVAVVRN